MIRLTGVGKRYGRGPLVVSNVNTEIHPGEPLVVHGANGTGKSTLLRIIAGCVAPTHGRVEGRPTTVGYVPDRFPASLRLPAGTYLRHMNRIRPRTTSTDDLLKQLGFHSEDTPMNRLSKGNAQKVGLAQALSSGAPLLVLDEPWSGLDAEARPVLTAAVERAVAAGVAVVLTDHTRTAETLQGHRAMSLHQNGLTEAGPRTVAITLRCADPDRIAAELAPYGPATQQHDGLTMRVPADTVDPLLLTALRLGCNVREVRECVH